MIPNDAMMVRDADLAKMAPFWETTEDILGGIHAMRDRREKYLPKFTDELGTTYEARLKTSTYTNIYRDILEGVASKPFAQEIMFEGEAPPQEILDFAENVDGAGNNLTVFASQTFYDGINTGMDWIFVDAPQADNTVRTMADVRERNIRPYWSRVRAANILSIRTVRIGSNQVLEFIRILEPGKPNNIREMERLPDGNVVYRLYEERLEYNREMKTYFWLVEQGSISIPVIPMVPFVAGRRKGKTWEMIAPMLDAVDLQVHLYQLESALKYVTMLAGYPMLAGNGVTPQKASDGSVVKLAVGPNVVLYSPIDGSGNHGEWKYVEPDANTMIFMSSQIEKAQQQLRELGRQPLTSQSGNLTVVTTIVAGSKAKSAVKMWANGLKDALENAFVITAMWMGLDYDPSLNVFTEFDDFIDGKNLEDLLAMYQAGVISMETLWYEYKRRGVLSTEFDAATERLNLLTTNGDDENDG
jgi:hypothetical protein